MVSNKITPHSSFPFKKLYANTVRIGQCYAPVSTTYSVNNKKSNGQRNIMKYQSEMCAIANCPPSNCIQDQLTAYRFVYEPVCEKSFVPQGLKVPSRMSNSNDKQKCSLLGLSFFSSEEKAKTRYEDLKKKMKNINKTIGSHIAKGAIDANDGYRTQISQKSGHFDFFECKSANLIPRFKVVCDLRVGL
jgi:hypothetical protein